ncbi:MAG: DsbA family protein [Pseudomonadales bacterium]|nr:DsbA family protein [Pseudomonadales bacterium]
MALKTRIKSTVINTLASAGYQKFRQRRARLGRTLAGKPPVIHYFHQVDDPHSQLAVQVLSRLQAAYRTEILFHLVSAPAAEFQGDASRYMAWTEKDASLIAVGYGLRLPPRSQFTAGQINHANNVIAAHAGLADIENKAADVSLKLRTGQLPEDAGLDPTTAKAIAAGNQMRQRLGHYQSAMFWFDGEWYWGVDRIRVLEARLQAEGFSKKPGTTVVPEPTPAPADNLQASHVQLEYFPSLRSPYTAIGHRRVLDLADRSGVNLIIRPVMPMMMRGVSAPFPKQHYIITDAAREARFRQVPFGNIVDPIGEPVRKAFALYPGAVKLNKGSEFVTAYLEAAWARGININSTQGLQTVAAMAGIDWHALTEAAADEDWEALLDENITAMLNHGLWGVPSFRVTGGIDQTPFACWGQDRIWRVEEEIVRRAGSLQETLRLSVSHVPDPQDQ